MANMIRVKISGLDEIQRRLESELPERAKAMLRAGLKEGAKVIQKEMQHEAPSESGILEENIGTRVSVKSNKISGKAFVGPKGTVFYPARTKVGWFGKTIVKRARMPVATIARFLEFGTKDMTARPFMTQSFERMKKTAVYKIIESLRKAVGLS